MEPQIQSPFMRFHVTYPFVTVLGALGALAGGLIGALTGNLDAGIAAGFVVGIVAGLIVGLHVMKHLKRGVDSQPPPGGWQRSDDDDDWDSWGRRLNPQSFGMAAMKQAREATRKSTRGR